MAAANSGIAYLKVDKALVKKANVSYAKIKDDILTQDDIAKKALEFFVENFHKVAESRK